MKLRFKKLRLRLRRQKTNQLRRFQRLRKHPVLVPTLFFVALVVLTVGGFLIFNHGSPKFQPITSYIVIISHDHEKQVVPTNEPTVGDLLKKLHIKLDKGDRVEPAPNTQIAQDNLRVNIYRAVPVEIVDGVQKTYGLSAATTSRSLAAQVGVAVYPEDNVKTEQPGDFVASGSIGRRVVVDRATPVNLNLYGTPTVVRTHAKTVADLIAQKGIILGAGDSVQPAPSTPLTPNALVYLTHKGTQIVSETESIPAPVQVVRDNSLSFGTSAVRQQGSPGQRVVTYQINTKNGTEVGRTLIQSVVTVQPVPQVVAQGQAVSIPADKQSVMARAGIAPGDYKYVDYIASHEGGWCPTKIQGTHNCPGYMNPSDVPAYGGYGIFQATPGSKMASAGSDWATSAVTQIRWATGYAVGRYGSWAGAYNHWVANHNW